MAFLPLPPIDIVRNANFELETTELRLSYQSRGRFLVKHKLGVQEAEDQTLLSMYLLSQSWVSSVSIMGASYGAYLSGMTASEDSASLAAAVVISPVTDWRYYDSVYTQRYMGTPQANPLGYAA